MLTPAQAAFLAALPQRPSRFNPWRSLAQATARQRVVLARMERRGFLPAAAAAVARAERLRLADEDARFLAPHFVGMVLADLPDPKPTRVVTTLDAALQRTIEGIVRSQRPLLEKHGATQRRDRRARQHDVAVAGVGRIGQLRRRSRRHRSTARRRCASPARR